MPHGTVTIVWSHGEDQFCLAQVKHILSLEDACGVGIAAVFGRLLAGTWCLHDVREPIRLGLIGGGMTPERAMQVVKRHVDGSPLAESVAVARAVIEAVLIGVPDDQPGKPAAAEAVDPTFTTMTDASAAPDSTGSAPLSASRPAPSTI
ncbi:hypothetical protein RHODGE_RHODGE_02832 [Rhodoplanes serenus]|uniref:Gene transfer agent family protein n=1 Tax=Rhodoplanes serenus TaxID=200615 RepID=A0A3S4FAM0_9BRAD|nr:gene transfer agent family protein [Rhodoplanes serenus]MBI5111300.1 gene transfer agent family protein [Rhodovulum sp.]VCU09663.1 hypothetical protein RHODGE_RHODGE_02832 [Rhodoplanes serenus]